MAWYNNSWTKRFKITVDHTKVAEALDTAFYDLANAPAGFWAAVRSDGGDIRVTTSDQVTEVAREVVGINVGGTSGQLFFAVPSMSTSVDVDFYIYYGNAGATEPSAGSTYGKNNVWTNYLAVFHMDESSGSVVCSKTGTSLTAGGSPTYSATGKLGKGIQFHGAEQFAGGDVFGITTAAITLTAWINPTSDDQYGHIVAKINNSDLGGYRWETYTSKSARFLVGNATNSDWGWMDINTMTTGLHLLGATYDGTNIRHYRDGSDVGGFNEATTTPTNSGASFTIGDDSDADYHQMDGIIDEVRVANLVRSANFLLTEYRNQSSPSTFFTTAAQENAPSGFSVTLPSITSGPTLNPPTVLRAGASFVVRQRFVRR